MDLVPESAPRLGIDARRRLVEQQQPGLVQHAGRQRQPLLPAARQGARELVLPRGKPQPLQRAVDPFLQAVEAIDATDELEVLADGEILVEAEALGHVAGLALDGLALAHQVVAEAGATAAIGRQQAADHAQRRGLARAVGAEEAADAALLDAKAQPVDDGARAVAFHQVVDVDREADGRRLRERRHADRQARRQRDAGGTLSGRASIRKTSLLRALCE